MPILPVPVCPMRGNPVSPQVRRPVSKKDRYSPVLIRIRSFSASNRPEYNTTSGPVLPGQVRQDLIFEIETLEARDATPKEIEDSLNTVVTQALH